MQWRSGLGLKAQEAAVKKYVGDNELVAEYSELASGRDNERPVLREAVSRAHQEGATLVVESVECLSRNACFVMSGLGVRFVAVEMPDADPNTIGHAALYAQKENEKISKRTRAALAQVKARGKKLGNPRPRAAWNEALKSIKRNASEYRSNLLPVIEDIRRDKPDATFKYVADELNRRGFRTARGNSFFPATVQHIVSGRRGGTRTPNQ